MTTSTMPSWLAELQEADFIAYGLQDQSLEDIAAGFIADDVNFDNVCRCLDLLRSGPYVLHCGAPLGLMSFSKTRDSYLACFDSAIDEEGKTAPQASLWLALLAAEAGMLPVVADDWSILRVSADGRGQGDLTLSGQNQAAIELYLAHRNVLTEQPAREDYESQLSCAVWTCAYHCWEGR